jgi:hypothetical protein
VIDLHQPGSFSVACDVLANVAKCLPLSLIITKNMVISLILELKINSPQGVIQRLAKVLHGRQLVGTIKKPHPQKVKMIGHQTKDRACQAVAK